MLRNTIGFTFIFVFASAVCFAQTSNTVLLKSRSIQTANDFSLHINDAVSTTDIYQGYYYRLIQFNEILSVQQRQSIEGMGVRLLSYIPNKAFYAAIPSGYNLTALNQFNPRAIIAITPQDKMSNQLRFGNIPDDSRNKNGTINLSVQYFSNLSSSEIKHELQNRGCTILESFNESHLISISVKESEWQTIVACSFIKHIEPLYSSTPDDTKGRSLHRSNCINADFGAGRHYDGNGVNIALADDGEVGPHIDFTGRLTNTFNTGAGGTHGDMTSGICVGAGNLDPVIRGMATGAHLDVYDIGVYPPDTLAGSYPQITDAAQHFANFGTVVTSTSYSAGCNDYDAFASMTDRIMHNLKYVCPVWSAGNNQGADCGYGAGTQWGNITGGFKQGKDVIACANLDAHEVVDASSSHGPAADGRIKPDISSNGKDEMSTAPDNTFQIGGGTSAACPGVAGITAQLYQAYRNVTGEANPEAALIKGCLLNSAWDIGVVGPDYSYGYGRVNALRAVKTIEEHRYLSDSVLQGTMNTHTISVPAGTSQMKVMVIWSDPEGDASAAIALVNNLDMQVQDPNAVTFNPWVLDPTPNSTTLGNPAVRGVDTLNNMEQVTIDNPTVGSYTITVNGTSVPIGTQKYYIVYEFWDDNITVTYPFGGEGFVPGETELLRWDAFSTTGNFLLEYSSDNGTSWNTIATVPGTDRQYDWIVPSISSGTCLLKISRGVSNDITDDIFSIIGTPPNLHIVWACVDSIKLAWDNVAGATGYEVSKLGAMYMDSIGTSSINEFVVTTSNPVDTFWYSVRALPGGAKGRRAIALEKFPGTFNCSLSQDMAVVSMIPVSGNFYDCGSGLDSVFITASISNFGFNTASGFDLTYTINGVNPITETFSGSLGFGQSSNYTFITPANLSVGGAFTINASVTLAGDLNNFNNSVSSSITVAMAAMAPLTEDFQGGLFPPQYWDTLNSNTTTTWQIINGITGSNGATTSAAQFDNCSYNANGASDALVTQLYDISSLTSPLMTFDVSYREFSGFTDALRIDVSADCGTTFLPTGYYKQSPQLTTVAGSTGCFTPSLGSDWRKDSVDLSTFGGGNIILRFVNIGGYGNLLFIDNVNVDNFMQVGISEHNAIPSIGVYPNPSKGIFNLDLKNIQGTNVIVKVLDASGREVRKEQLKNSSHIQTTLDLNSHPAGIYYLQVSTDQRIYHLLLTKM